MSNREDEDDAATAVRAFSPADIVKLFSATYLPLCQYLDDAGVATKADIAKALRHNVKVDEREPWAALVLALAIVLERDDEPKPAETKASAVFSIIDGGLAKR